ncbi:MAG: hypothetical protein ACP5G2_08485 [Candidatus Bipolaricaulaceae bacterium]
MSRRAWMVLVAVVLLGLVALGQQREVYYLTGNIPEASGTVSTDKGDRRVTFFGAVAFRVVPGARGSLGLSLIGLNLVSAGLATERGPSGVLGLDLMGEAPLQYDPRSGQAAGELRLGLHYELIDRIKGFRQLGGKGEEDVFAPFTEEMGGKITVQLPEALKVTERGSVEAELNVKVELSSVVLGVLRRVFIATRVIIDWTKLLTPAEYLRIQPVFIGTGPADATATGKAFAELMKRSHDLWNRCSSVRCIKFVVNTPIYINKPAYKVLDSEAEAANLRAEVSVANAVEVFFVDRMSFVCSWGGGACFSSGTASAKVVSCDQQLAVPAPCPCPGYCPVTCPPCPPCQTGAVNYYHLAHELGHALDLAHPPGPSGGLAASTVGSNMEPSGFCCDNPNVQSAKNCRNAANPLLYWGKGLCFGNPDIMD